MTKLGEICQVVRGSSPRPQGDSRFYGGGVPRLMVADVTRDGMYVTPMIDSLTVEGAARSRPMNAGDLVIAVSGAPGLPAILTVDACIHDGFVGLRDVDNKRVDTIFLYRYLNYVRTTSSDKAVGAIFKNLTTDQIRELEIPLPPLSEQKRIAAILDQADSLRRKREQSISLIDRLLHTTFVDMFGDPSSFPAQALSSIAEVVSGVAKGRRLGGEAVMVPYLRVANVQDGYLNLDEIKTIEALPHEVKSLKLMNGDVVMTEGGDHDKLGRGAIWNASIPNCIHQNHVFRVRVNASRLYPVFFASFLRTSQAKQYFLRCAKKTTNLASINMTQLRGLPVPIPPIPLQQQFERAVAVIKESALKCKESAGKSRSLFDSLVQRAFRGEL